MNLFKHIIFRFFILLTILVVYLFFNYSEPLNKKFEVYYFSDKLSNMTYSDIIKVKFVDKTTNNFSLGYIKNNVWFKFKINKAKKELILDLNEYNYESAVLYYYNTKGKLVENEKKLTNSIKNRDIPSSNIIFKINNLKDNEFVYLKLRSNYSIVANIQIYDKFEYIFIHNMNINTLIILFISITLILLIISLFLSFIFKDKVLLYFAFLCGTYMLYFISSSGVYIYLNLGYLHNIFCYCPLIVIISLLLFSSSYLNIKKHLPFMYLIFNIYISIILLLIVCSIFHIYDAFISDINGILALITYALIIYSSFLISKKIDDNKYIKYFMWVNILVFISLLFFESFLFGLLEYTIFIRYGLIFSLTIKIVVLAFLLIKYIIEKENKIKMKDMEDINFYNNLVMKEMNHRIKNNFHFIMSVLHLENKKKQYSETVYLELISRISSFSSMHEQLYLTNDKNVSISEYLSAITNDIKNIYVNFQGLKISQNIDRNINLHYEYFLYLGVILSELITNSLKHNKGVDKLKISINLIEEKNEMIKFIVRDNGRGFKKEEKSNSLGLEIIKDFCNRMDNSSYDLFSDNGTVFLLSFKNKEDVLYF